MYLLTYLLSTTTTIITPGTINSTNNNKNNHWYYTTFQCSGELLISVSLKSSLLSPANASTSWSGNCRILFFLILNEVRLTRLPRHSGTAVNRFESRFTNARCFSVPNRSGSSLRQFSARWSHCRDTRSANVGGRKRRRFERTPSFWSRESLPMLLGKVSSWMSISHSCVSDVRLPMSGGNTATHTVTHNRCFTTGNLWWQKGTHVNNLSKIVTQKESYNTLLVGLLLRNDNESVTGTIVPPCNTAVNYNTTIKPSEKSFKVSSDKSAQGQRSISRTPTLWTGYRTNMVHYHETVHQNLP